MKDLTNAITPKRAISPVSVADNTALVGEIIDKKGYESVTYIVCTGSIADSDATFAVRLEDGNDSALSDAAAVADADLLGTEVLAAFKFDDDNKCRKLGYIGAKRYTRLTITPAGNASAALISAVAILGNAHIQPTANPPV